MVGISWGAHRIFVGACFISTDPGGQSLGLTAAVIFADPSGRIVETNRQAEALLRLGDGLTMRDGRPCAQRSFETAKLMSLIAEATAGSGAPNAGCMLIGRDSGRPALIVRVAPVSAQQARYDTALAMILISIPSDNRVSERELAELYGLSRAEARLALALERGKRMNDLVSEFGVQITTLRTQLSSALKKCGVERQSDLVRLIAGIPVVDLPRPERADVATQEDLIGTT
ncbi:MAG TPA: hypothetical protein VME45_10630 [Stellaceae bacterium]|nr:hypothetical protein [Stellaceae bacterium]